MEISELENQINTVVRKIQGSKHDPQLVLECANSLSTLMFNLAPLYIASQEESIRAEKEYKDFIDEMVLELRESSDSTVAEAEAKARMKGKEMYSNVVTKQMIAKKLSMLREDIDRKISLLQSWSSELRSQRTFRP